MLKERSLPLKTVDEYRELFDFPVRDYYEKLGYNFDHEPFDEVGMEFIVQYNKRQGETRLHREALEVLEMFAGHGFSQSILSAREQNELVSEIKNQGISGFFDHICGLDDHYAHGKTDVGIRLVNDLAMPKEKLLFIGDTRHDAEVAAEMGIDCILLPNGHQSRERLLWVGVPVLRSLMDLIELL